MFVCVDLLCKVFGQNMVGITEKVTVGQLPFSQSFGQEEKGFSYDCGIGWGGVASEAAPWPRNTGNNKKTQGTHCLVIP